MHANTGYSTIYSSVTHHSEPHSLSWSAQRTAVAGLTVGTLYGGAAVLSSTLTSGKLTLVPMLQWVTADVLGAGADVSEGAAAVFGVSMHLVLSVAFAVGYALIVTRFPVPHGSEVLAGLVYGALVGVVMSAFVFPLAHVDVDLFDANRFLLFLSANMMLVGVPISLMLGRSENR